MRFLSRNLLESEIECGIIKLRTKHVSYKAGKDP